MEGLLQLIYPPACVACDEVLPGSEFFCADCAPLVLETVAPWCDQCSEPGNHPASRCPRCTSRPPPFRQAFAPYEHDGAVAKAIHRFKYEDRSDLSRPLSSLLAAHSEAFLEVAAGVLVPIPLHASRFRERGYDQAALLASELGALLNRPVRHDWLVRVRATERQVGRSEEARLENVRDAFAVEGNVAGHPIVLIDDVYTTGSTATEAAKTLLRAGASRVEVLTLARARRALV